MSNYNLALLSPDDRADIELRKQASLIAFNFNRGTIDRKGVLSAIEKSKGSDKLRVYINQSRGM